MTTPITTNGTGSQMHNNIMDADRNANPLALVAATQRYPDPCYQAPKQQNKLIGENVVLVQVCCFGEKGVPLQAEQADWLEDTD
ncbi:hypothetical protein Tco_1323855 [Tanacetum coccineum]